MKLRLRNLNNLSGPCTTSSGTEGLNHIPHLTSSLYKLKEISVFTLEITEEFCLQLRENLKFFIKLIVKQWTLLLEITFIKKK